MENYSIEIIKVLQFFTCLDNFIFVLPMNKAKIKFMNYVDAEADEDSIDKYITLGTWFYFYQDFTKLLKKFSFPEMYVNDLNRILNVPQKNNKKIEYILSHRELENCLNMHFDDSGNNTIVEEFKKNKYKGLIKFSHNIWESNEIETDINKFISKIRFMKDEIYKFYPLLDWIDFNKKISFRVRENQYKEEIDLEELKDLSHQLMNNNPELIVFYLENLEQLKRNFELILK